MGFFSRLAHKVGGAVKSAVRFGVKHSEGIERVAHKVGSMAGKVGDVATAGAVAMGSNPVGAFLGGVAGVSKAVGRGAGAVEGVAHKVSGMKARFGGGGGENRPANSGAVRMLGRTPQLQLGN